MWDVATDICPNFKKKVFVKPVLSQGTDEKLPPWFYMDTNTYPR